MMMMMMDGISQIDDVSQNHTSSSFCFTFSFFLSQVTIFVDFRPLFPYHLFQITLYDIIFVLDS
jgi:hypothetical protein